MLLMMMMLMMMPPRLHLRHEWLQHRLLGQVVPLRHHYQQRDARGVIQEGHVTPQVKGGAASGGCTLIQAVW